MKIQIRAMPLFKNRLTRWIRRHPGRVALVVAWFVLLGVPVAWAFYTVFLLGRYTRGLSISIGRKKKVYIRDVRSGKIREATLEEQSIIDAQALDKMNPIDPTELFPEDMPAKKTTTAKSIGKITDTPDTQYALEKDKNE